MGISIEMQLTFGAGSNVLVCIKEELADYPPRGAMLELKGPRSVKF